MYHGQKAFPQALVLKQGLTTRGTELLIRGAIYTWGITIASPGNQRFSPGFITIPDSYRGGYTYEEDPMTLSQDIARGDWLGAK